MGEISWFSLGTAEKLLSTPANDNMLDIQRVLSQQVYHLFEKKIQINHLQFHHYCQPRQNESMQGRIQFDEKNKLTLEPVLNELEELYVRTPEKQKNSIIYLHFADANLDEFAYRRTDLLTRIQNLARTGHVKIAGGILDEAFIGPDSEEFSAAAIISYFEKVIRLFGQNAVAPLVWIPERFFEKKTASILEKVYHNFSVLQQFPYLSIIVDENVIEHSLHKNWKGNLFTGWSSPDYPSLRVFVGSNHLRAIMPQANPEQVNSYFFSLMNEHWNESTIQMVNWFISEYEHYIRNYYELNMKENIKAIDIETLKININRFYLEAREKLEQFEPLFVFFIDDLEKNGSWKGTYQFAFEHNRHFYWYIRQSENIFNPYQMKPLLDYTPNFQFINKIKPSSYKEFSIIWNNNPMDVEKWRELTLLFIKNNLNSVHDILNLTVEQMKQLKITEMEILWYREFIINPIGWQEGQLSKYPEIRLNYLLAQLLYQEIIKENSLLDIHRHLNDDSSLLGNLLHIWNKNRSSCPNFIGYFGGTSILFFRLHIAMQLAVVLTLKYADLEYIEKDLAYQDEEYNICWTYIKVKDNTKILDERGDTIFTFNDKNFHNLVAGFSRHREGYNSIIKNFLNGRQDIENFALVEKSQGTTSAHPFVIALDLENVERMDVIRKTYPEDLEDFDNEEEMMNPFPIAWEQIWILPPNTFENPILNYQEGFFGDFKWLTSERYLDFINGKRTLTFVKRALYQQKHIEVIKKIDPMSEFVRVEVWNRSNLDVFMNPTIAFPTALDWYEGDNYLIENEQLPLNGDIKCFDRATITVLDKISNLKLTLSALRDDMRFCAATAYTYQTSDRGVYTVAPQHELILLSSKHVINLKPGEGYIMEYSVKNESIGSESLWNINWDAVPEVLKQKIQKFSDMFLKGKNLTEFQKTKIIYARFPEIIFWVR
ncbi:MAG: hypothetical protein PHV30_11180 [Candidatus Margulisbacteria bacterium]|nr:hypothetical protein [Candidatus Margulisiibacteriota bacterium]